MATIPVGEAGLQGVRAGFARAQDAASRIAASTAAGDLDDIVEAVVDLKQAELQVQAAARVIEADVETRGRLIDILA